MNLADFVSFSKLTWQSQNFLQLNLVVGVAQRGRTKLPTISTKCWMKERGRIQSFLFSTK